MDHHQGHGQPQMPYGATQYQANQMIRPSPSGPFDTSGGGTMQITGQPTAQLAYQQIHQQQQQLQNFWADKCLEIEETTDFKNHSLPLARIKKIMKADEDVKMISAEAPVIFARACEMFILELTLRSWNHTEESKRRTLQKNDIAAAIARTDIFDFLVDIEPREDLKDEVPSGGTMPVGDLADPLPYYYMTPQLSAQQSHHPYLTQQVYPQSLQHHQQPPADS